MFTLSKFAGKLLAEFTPVGKVYKFNKKLESFFVKNKNFVFSVFIIFIILTFLTKAQIFLDPDFGWRLSHGQMILENGFAYTDPFSYTMPSFPFVDHAWLVSYFIGLTYPVFGKSLLSIVACAVLFLTVFVSFGTSENNKLKTFSINPTSRFWMLGHPLVLLALAILLPFFSIRAQITSWLMFSIVVYLTSNEKKFEKYKYFLPVFFLIWANLHGGYALGLFVLYFTVASDFVRNYSEERSSVGKKLSVNIPIIIFSTLAIFVNPYGAGSVKEVYSSITDSSLRFKIAEWLPSLTYFDLSVALYLPVVATIVYLKRNLLSLEKKIFFVVLFLFALSSRRNFPFWVIYSLPVASDLLQKFYEDFSNKKMFNTRFWVVYRYFLTITVGVFILQTFFYVWRVFVPSDGGGYYPIKAVEVLKQDLPDGEIFSNYGWGGYLIWQLPEKRVFVDGRMPSWRFDPPNDYESASAFDDYNRIKQGELDFNKVSGKYNIDTVLWPKEEDTFSSYLEQQLKKLFNEDDEKFQFDDYLIKNGWMLVYEDKEALIYKKFMAGRI